MAEEYVPGPPEPVSPDDPLVHGNRWRRERDEAIALLHRAAFRLVPLSPYDEIRAFLDRVASDEDDRG